MIGDHLGKRTQRIDYRAEIMDAVRERDGISKDGVFDVVGGYRNTVIKRIDDLIGEGFLGYENRRLHLKYVVIEDHFMRILRLYRENLKNIFPNIKKNVKKSGKPLFYTERAEDVLGIDGRTNKPFTGVFHRVNESAKSDLVTIMYEVNMLIRAGTAVYLDSLKAFDQPPVPENWDVNHKNWTLHAATITQEKVVKLMKVLDDELKELEAKLRKMAGKKEGSVVFEQWWQQQMFGLVPIKF